MLRSTNLSQLSCTFVLDLTSLRSMMEYQKGVLGLSLGSFHARRI